MRRLPTTPGEGSDHFPSSVPSQPRADVCRGEIQSRSLSRGHVGNDHRTNFRTALAEPWFSLLPATGPVCAPYPIARIAYGDGKAAFAKHWDAVRHVPHGRDLRGRDVQKLREGCHDCSLVGLRGPPSRQTGLRACRTRLPTRSAVRSLSWAAAKYRSSETPTILAAYAKCASANGVTRLVSNPIVDVSRATCCAFVSRINHSSSVQAQTSRRYSALLLAANGDPGDLGSGSIGSSPSMCPPKPKRMAESIFSPKLCSCRERNRA